MIALSLHSHVVALRSTALAVISNMLRPDTFICYLQHVLQAARQAARAAHICPWGSSQQAALCRTALGASTTAAPAVAHLSTHFGLSAYHAATQSYRPLPDDQLPIEALQDIAAAGVDGMTCQPCAVSGLEAAQQQYKVGPAAVSNQL